jgi:hypothetical protein
MKARIKELANVKMEDIYTSAKEIVFDLERGLQVYNNADIANKYIKNALKIEWIVDENLDFLNARIFIHDNLVINTESNSVLTEKNLESELYSKQHSIFTCEGRDSLSLFYFDMTVKLDNTDEYDRRSSIMWQAAKAEYLSKQKR